MCIALSFTQRYFSSSTQPPAFVYGHKLLKTQLNLKGNRNRISFAIMRLRSSASSASMYPLPSPQTPTLLRGRRVRSLVTKPKILNVEGKRPSLKPKIENQDSVLSSSPVCSSTKIVMSTDDTVSTPPPRKKRKRLNPADISPGPNKKPPKNWKSIYNLIIELRSDRSAPVDTDGSEALPEPGEHHAFQTLIALMLSSQTRDQAVGSCMRALQAGALCPPLLPSSRSTSGLTLQTILSATQEHIASVLREHGIGFHNNKAGYIKKTASVISDTHGGAVPCNLSSLIALPGVGPKMALIILNVAFDEQPGISVDTHVHRICKQLGWTKNPKDPEDTRRQLESWLPKDEWGNINLLLVGIGQEVQTQRQKLLGKCLNLKQDRVEEGLRLLKKLGMDIKKEMALYNKIQ